MTRRSFAKVLEPHLRREHVSSVRRGAATVVTICKPDSLSIEVTIPDDVFEWWVSVIDSATGREFALDWCDHYGDADEQLHEQMAEEIGTFMDGVVDAPVRLVSKQKPSWLPWRKPRTTYVLQRQAGADWVQAIPFAIA